MIKLFLWFLFILLCSLVAEAFYSHAHTPGYKTTINLLRFVGVAVHELAHYTLATIFGTNPGKLRIKYRSEVTTGVNPHGSMTINEFDRHSLLQTFAIGFAPLLVSTFLFMFCLDLIFTIQTDLWVKVAAAIFGGSLLLGLVPSGQDIRLIGKTFQKDPRYSVYQIFLLVFAGIFVWLFVELYFFVLPFEVLYYIAYFVVLTVFYFTLKGVLMIFGKIFQSIAKKIGKSQVSSPKFLTRRRRFKHIKDPNEREVQW
ncbi:MAG: hypothetical protein ACTSQL_12330, partial [Promethearchaeota archaeon]